MIAPGNAGIVRPMGVKFVWIIKLKMPLLSDLAIVDLYLIGLRKRPCWDRSQTRSSNMDISRLKNCLTKVALLMVNIPFPLGLEAMRCKIPGRHLNGVR